ncbi:MAG: GspE/PulE family protein [Planctomycetota bacterium]
MATATTPAPAVVERLLTLADETGASDLHLEPSEDGIEVKLRRDGVLTQHEVLPTNMAPQMVGRLKALASLLAYRTDVPQEGRIPADRSGIRKEVRVATYPTLLGERVAIRLDAPQGASQALESLGLADDVLDSLKRAIEQPSGVLLVTGPSGSGKTTTLYSCLRHLTSNERRRSVMTVEDPIERRIPGVTQTEVNLAAGLSFERALRSLLRQDPEVLLVGEIRDRETASIALEAGLTGHLVASTIHAGTAPQVFARLLEMQIEPFVLTTAVRGVLAQRLLRRRCPRCSGTSDCSTCHGIGYAGRCLVAEWLPMSEPLRRVILARGDGDAFAAAAEESGFRPLREHARQLVAQGTTTEEEIHRVLGNS